MLGYRRTKIGAIVGAVLGISLSVAFIIDTGQLALGMMLGITLMSSIIMAFIFWITYTVIPPIITKSSFKTTRNYTDEELEKIQRRMDELRHQEEYNYVPNGLYDTHKPTNRLTVPGQRLVEKEFNMGFMDINTLVLQGKLKDVLVNQYDKSIID